MGRFNLAMPARQVPVTRFEGLFTLADPRDFPEGASWLAQDVDFTIAGAGPRPGLTGAISFSATPGQLQWFTAALLGALNTLLAQDKLGSLWSRLLAATGPLSPIYSGILNGARALGLSANLREYICLSNVNNVASYPLLPTPGALQGTDQPRNYDGIFLDRVSQMGPGVGPAVATVESANTPAAPVLSYVTGGDLPVRTAWVVVANISGGVLAPSAEASILLGAGTKLVVDSPASASGVTGWNVYVSEQEAGAETQQNTSAIAIGTNWTEPVTGLTTTGVAAPVAQVAAGPRYAIVFYLTRSGYLTPASPPVAFSTDAGTIGLTFSNLCTGPANVLQRIVAWTPANAAIGGSYFYVPGTVTDENGNQVQASIVPDNTTTSFTINISDQVLLEGVNVSGVDEGGNAVTGNNLFTVRELGEPVKGEQYAGRTFFMGCRNKVDQFLNTTFDGGGSAANPVSGWTPQSPDGSQTHELVTSPIFGFSYYYKNGSAGTVNPSPQAGNLAALDMIAQPAAQTALGTPILIQGRRYGVRATVWSPGGNATGEVWIGFASAITNEMDVYRIPASRLTTEPQEFIGPLGSPATGRWLSFPVEISPGVYAGLVGPGASAATQIYKGTNVASAATTSDSTGSMEASGAYPPFNLFTTCKATLTFNDFVMPALPAGAIVTAVQYQVRYTGTFATDNPGAAYSATDRDDADIGLPALPSSGTWTSSSFTTDTSFLSGALITFEMGNTSQFANFTGSLSIFSVGYLVTFSSPTAPVYNPTVTRFNTIPPDLKLVAIPVGWPAGADLEIDRIEIFDWDQPVLQNQVVASYGAQPEAFDGVTGLIDISNYTTDPITNIFRFLNQLYICTARRWFATQDNGTTEPDDWTLSEVSNAVGCLGPMAADVGEEFVLAADLRGLWIFDGGSHVKLSQEVQDLWDSLNFALSAGFWLVNDRHRQRVLFGCALPTPGNYTRLPAATPTQNNVTLLCSYLTLAPGSTIAMSPGVTVSAFTGQVISREGGRKWAVWSIPAWYGEFMPQGNGSEALWLGSGKTAKIYFLDAANSTDDGAAIAEAYGTSNFSDTQTEQNLQLGSARKIYGPISVLMDVMGQFKLSILPETQLNPNPVVLPLLGGESPALGDTFLPVSVPGNRVFLLFETDGLVSEEGVGSSFTLRRIVMGAQPHPRIPVTGRLG